MTRAPFKLSREMKLLLGLLLLVAAIGLWYVLTNRGGADTQTATTPATTGTPAPGDTVPVTPAGQGDTAAGPAGSGVQSSGQVDVEVIPPFPTGAAAQPTATPDTPPTPAGINPAGKLASTPGHNPLRPLVLDNTGTTTTSTETAAAQGGGLTAGSPGSVSAGVATTPEVTPVPSGGTLGLNPISGASSSGTSSVGAIPLQIIPGQPTPGQTGSSSGSPVTVTPLTPGGTVTAGSSGTGTQGQSTPVTPVRPPVAGVNVPSVTRVPSLTTGAISGGVSGAAAGQTSLPGTPLPTSAPQPGTPQVISELDSGAQSAPAATALETFVQSQQLAFNAVVLGPVNTAIFRSKDGYVVVAVGQTLPDSQVTVKDVTATSATLSLGTDSKTLELDKR